MFEKIGQLAEKAATNVDVSRRGFLGRLGKSAIAVAGMLGFAAPTAEGRSGGSNKVLCCYYDRLVTFPGGGSGYVTYVFCATNNGIFKCPAPGYGGGFVGSTTKSQCKFC